MKKIKTKIEPRGPQGIYWIVIVCIIILIFGYILQQADFALDKVASEFSKPENIRYITGVFVSIAVGVLSSGIYMRYYSRHAERTLDEIHSVGYGNLVDSLINQVASYNDIVLTGFRLSITLRPSPCGRYIKVKQIYEYKKTLGSVSNILFRFKRLKTEEEGVDLYNEPTLLSEDYKRYEFFFKLNDAQFIEKGIPESEISSNYRVSNVVIDGQPCQISNEVGTEDTYLVTLPINKNDTNERNIEFTVEYPIDWDDYVFILFEYPAKEVRIEFDYSDVVDQINFHRVEFLGYELGFSGQRDGENGVSTIVHHGWLMPKSGVIYIWYDSRISANQQPI